MSVSVRREQEPVEREEVIGIFRKQVLKARVIHACKKCTAPGYWHDREGWWPACYDPVKKREGDLRGESIAPVGDICPNCGARRDIDIDDKGTIWSKIIRGPTAWEQIRRSLFWWREA